TGALQAALVDGDQVLDAAVALGPADGQIGSAGTDFIPEAGQATRLAGADVAFEPEVFDSPGPSPAAAPVDVRATVRAAAPGVDLEALRVGVTARLTGYLAALTAGSVVTAQALLDAVRDDAAYALDPLGLVVTFTT